MKIISFFLFLIAATASAQNFDEGPNDGSFTLLGSEIENPLLIAPVSQEYEDSYQSRISVAAGARDWDCNSTSRGDADNGKRYWSLLLAQLYNASDNSSDLESLIENEGHSGLFSTYQNEISLYKPFSAPGLCMYFLGYYELLPTDQKKKVEQMWNSEGREYTSRSDHQMDPIYDLTEYNSENFHWMSRMGGYLLSHKFNDRTDVHGLPAMEYYDEWMKNLTRATYNTGRVEWGSDIYSAYCLNPALVTYEYADDVQTRIRARAILDWMVFELAYRHIDGFQSGPGTRQKGGEMKPFYGESWGWEWLYFSDNSYHPSFSTSAAGDNLANQMIGFMLHGTYRPPQAAVDIAQRNFQTPVEMHNAKPYIHADNENYNDWRGETDKTRRWEFETMWIEKDYTLGSVASYRPAARAQLGGNQTPFVEQGLWRLAIRGTDNGALRLVGSAGDQTGGTYWNARYPYEEIGQYRNVMMRLIKAPSLNDLYIISPQEITFTTENGGSFAQAPNGVYIAVVPYNGSAPTSDDLNTEFKRYKWEFPEGELGGLVMEVGTEEEYGSYDNFKDAIQENMSTLEAETEHKIAYTSTSSHGGTIAMEYQGPTTYTSTVFDIDITPAGNLPKVWGDGQLFDYSEWQSYNVIYGEQILNQNWGSGALTATAGGKGVQIVVDPVTAVVTYRQIDDDVTKTPGTVQKRNNAVSPLRISGSRIFYRDLQSDATLYVYTMTGRLARKFTIKKGRGFRDLSSLPSGIYSVRLGGHAGENRSLRFVKTVLSF